MSRKRNSARNAIVGIVKTIISIFFPFIIRTIIIKYLGAQFAGLSGLFTSILSVLNLAELGLSSAIIFNMYKPIANKDIKTVRALLNFYKKIYRIIGLFILIVGILIIPIIPKLINGSWPSTINIYILYILYLLNTSVSYFVFAEKSALLTALQRIDLVDISFLIAQLFFYCIEILILILTKNFYCYIIASIAKTLTCNLITAAIAHKKYPEYAGKEKINSLDICTIKKQVGSLFIGKIGDVSRNALDNIIISMLFGLTSVTLYGNYYYIFNALYAFILVLSRATTASIGDSVVKENLQQNYETLTGLYFIFNWVITVCTVCLLCSYQNFIALWLGEDFLLSTITMIQFCIYFYLISSNCVRNNFIDGNGLWNKLKTTYILEAISNLILNILLGYLLGLNGVVLATIITIFIFNYVSRTNILFKEYFKQSPKNFYKNSAAYTIILIIISIITYTLSSIRIGNEFLIFVVNAIISFIISNSLLFLFYRRTNQYAWARNIVKSFFRSHK